MKRELLALVTLGVAALGCGGSTQESEITGMVDVAWEDDAGHTIQYTGDAGLLYTCEGAAGRPEVCTDAGGRVVDVAEISGSYRPGVCARYYLLTVAGQPIPRHVVLRCWE